MRVYTRAQMHACVGVCVCHDRPELGGWWWWWSAYDVNQMLSRCRLSYPLEGE